MRGRILAYSCAALLLLAIGCSDKGTLVRTDTGNVPVVSLSVTALEFHATQGEKDTLTLTIGNTGRATLEITELRIEGADVFTVSAPPATLEAGSSADVDVVFASAGANATATLTIVSNAPVAPPTVSLMGNAGSGSMVTFTTDVKPILVANCALSSCHDAFTITMGLDLSTYASARSEVVPGSPATSKLYLKLQPVGNMPFGRPALSTENRQTIYDWIADGALE